MGDLSLHVDITDLQMKMHEMELAMSEEQFERLLYRTFGEVGKRVKSIVKTTVPQEYNVGTGGKAWVGEAVKKPQTERNGETRCIIPVAGERGTVGGRFKAKGGMPGWSNIGHKYRVQVEIVKGQTTTLPERLAHQGNMEPWRNTSPNITQPGFAKAVFTRKDKRFKAPVASVKGIAVPQMPLNLSREETERMIHDKLEERLEHNFNYLMGKL